jgi:hypothetical protein
MPIARAATTTAFCAVWSSDPDRWELLRGHQACLEAQTVPVTPLYVFDDGDDPPDWVRGRRVVADEPLSIYQAWNVATQLVDSEMVMNLNLDDRLAADAVELLEGASEGVELVGGDWTVCYSQRRTDAVTGTRARPADRLPFDPAWPPRTGTRTRLGSGTGERGTLGPATMWRRSLHRHLPYPWAFGDGQPIRIVGDLAWWTAVQRHLRAHVRRVPMLIGHYHSHPHSQAEFRTADEHGILASAGIQASNYPMRAVRVLEDRP